MFAGFFFGHWVSFMSRYPFASLSSANGFSHPGPKCYEGSLPQPRKSPSSSSAKVSGMRKLGSPLPTFLWLLTWHLSSSPGNSFPLHSPARSDLPASSSYFPVVANPTVTDTIWGRMSGLMTRQDRVACGSRETERAALVTGKCPETSFQIIPGHWAPSNPHPPITHHNLVIINKLNQTEQKYRQIFLSFP